MRELLVLIIACNFTFTFAEDLQALPYENTYKCSVAMIHTIGRRCETEESCPTVSPFQYENAEIITQGSKKFLIPSLAQSFPKSKRILRDEGSAKHPQPRIYGIEKVICLSNEKIGVLYYAGGNCNLGCENYVIYTISRSKGLIDALLSK